MKNGTKQGFTLIEMMVTVSILAVIAGLAAPGLRAFLVKNKMASISNEFSAALSQTRALAITRNSCASLCASTDVSSSGTSTCSNKGTSDDFQAGWLIFVNPTCDATQTDPTTAGASLAALRRGESSGYSIKPSVAALSIVMYDPRGFANLAAKGSFKVNPPSSSDDTYKRTICLDAAGRPTVRKTLSTEALTCS